MKKLTTLLLLPMLLLACEEKPKAIAPPKIDEIRETQAIMEVIKQETDCFFTRNFDCWQETYAHTSDVMQRWNNQDGTFTERKGWKMLSESIKTFLRQQNWGEQKIERRNISIKFYSNSMAYLHWDQYIGDVATQKYILSKDSRIMEKINGEWKIVNVTAIWDYKNQIPFSSLTLPE